MKKTVFLSLAAILLLTACGKDEITTVEAYYFDNVDNVTFDRTVTITYSSATATVDGTSSDQSVSTSGAGVTITNLGSEVVKYVLSGSTTDGYLKIYSAQAQAIVLNGVSIANPAGAAINVQGPADAPSSGERLFLVLSGASTLADGSTYSATPEDEDEKAALFAEGVIAISGSGSLTVNASGKSGIASDDYVHLSEGTVTVNSTASTSVSNGDTLKIAGIKSKDDFVVDGGTLVVSASGTGAKGISGDSAAHFNGGSVTVTVTGSNFGTSTSGGMGPGNSSSNGVAAKGVKFDGDITISGGTLTVSAANHEGIESKTNITVGGGQTYSYSGADDAVNASGDITLSGGYLAAISTANDGLDANGSLYLKGGVLYAVGATSPEEAIDVNIGETSGVELVLDGGTIIAIGGLSSGAELNQSCYSASYTSGTVYTLLDGSTTYSFTAPAGAGSPLVVSGTAVSLYSGGTLSGGTACCNNALTIGATLSGGSSVSLSAYSGGNGGGGGNPGGGPGGGGHHISH